jgi:excisionase family DNA binding protein
MIDRSARLLYRIPEAADQLGLSRSTLYELVAAGELRVVKIGRAVRIPAAELTDWVERQAAAAQAGGSTRPNADAADVWYRPDHPNEEPSR